MKFIKIKIAILMIVLFVLSCLIGIIFKKNFTEKYIKIYDVSKDEIIEISVNDYLIGVVAAEMPSEFEIEALKSQAVAARTYLINKGKCQLYNGSDICTDSTHCQAYKSYENLKKQWGNDFRKNYKKIASAVYETKDEIMVYENQPISAVFHSTSSGRTENSEDVWSKTVPYLRSVESSDDINSPKYLSEVKISIKEFKNKLSEKYKIDFSDTLIGDITRTEGGSVDYILIGNTSFRGTEIRSIFSLNSANFTIDVKNDDVIFTVYGYGHGVGMSQYGANFMAKSGYNYVEILKKYYSGIDITSTDYEYNVN